MLADRAVQRRKSGRIQRERKEQEAFVRWCKLNRHRFPGVDKVMAIPNGAHLQGDARRRAMQWASLVRMGAVEGASDLLLPVARHGFHGLWIEMKAPKPHDAPVTDEQRGFIASMIAEGYEGRVAYGWEDAVSIVEWYYGGSHVSHS